MPHCLPHLQADGVVFPPPFSGTFVSHQFGTSASERGTSVKVSTCPMSQRRAQWIFTSFPRKSHHALKESADSEFFFSATYPFRFRALEFRVLTRLIKPEAKSNWAYAGCTLQVKSGGGRRGKKITTKKQKKKPETILVLTLHRHLLIRILIQHIWRPNSSLICPDS